MQKLKLNRKIMVVSNYAPPAPGGSPQVLYNLFSQFDPASYVLYTHEKNSKLPRSERTLPCTHYFYEAPKRNAFLKNSTPLPQLLALMRTVKKGLKIIKEERVEVILGTSDKGTALFLTLVLSVTSRRPYILYMLDPYRGTNATRLRELASRMLEPIFFAFAHTVITTNDGHRELYCREYGNPSKYAVVYHALPSAGAKMTPSSPQSSHTILYSGSIYFAQEKSIRNLIEAVESMPDFDIRILLYVPKNVDTIRESFSAHPIVSVDTASPEEIRLIQERADILFLPLVWDMTPGLAAMAIPGKTPEYLVSGKPILVHAPPHAYLSRYAQKEGFAHVVVRESKEELQSGLRKLLTDRVYVKQLVERAHYTFEKNHRAENCARAFKTILDNVTFKTNS